VVGAARAQLLERRGRAEQRRQVRAADLVDGSGIPV